MHKWIGTKRGRRVIGFGLSEGNVAMLRSGNPVYIFAEDLPGLGADVMIYYGKGEKELSALVEPMLTEDTVIKDQRQRKKQ